MVETSIKSGVNWLDTSENYLDTRNESLIGAALCRVSDDFLIATKVAPRDGVTGGGSGFRRDQIHAACRASLRRLGRDVIDVYFLHWPDDTGVSLKETWDAMVELVDEGLVRSIGMSNYDLADVERCHAERCVDVVQTGLSMIDYLDDRDMISRCGELGIGVVITVKQPFLTRDTIYLRFALFPSVVDATNRVGLCNHNLQCSNRENAKVPTFRGPDRAHRSD